jgi:FkbM family methyltransferase
MARRWGFRGEIISFEPSAEDFRELADLASLDPLWRAHNFALGANPGNMTLNISCLTAYNSFLPLSREAPRFDKRSTVVHTQQVEVKRLDDIVAGSIPASTLLKVDTQGFEREVLEGAQKTLDLVKGVLLELPIVNLYERTWSFSEALDYMVARGWLLAQVEVVSYDPQDGVSAIEFDCLFRRSQSQS